jgi:ElaB/YqjD/DUF883 family membrane-anchored ribosome-binding protein
MTSRAANEVLVGDLNRIVSDAEELLQATAGEASEKVKEVRGRLATAIESANATCDYLQEKTVESAKATRHVIHEHLYGSIGVAFGVGLLIGVLVGRH